MISIFELAFHTRTTELFIYHQTISRSPVSLLAFIPTQPEPSRRGYRDVEHPSEYGTPSYILVLCDHILLSLIFPLCFSNLN